MLPSLIAPFGEVPVCASHGGRMTDGGRAVPRDRIAEPAGLTVVMEEPSHTVWALVLCRSVLGMKAALAG